MLDIIEKLAGEFEAEVHLARDLSGYQKLKDRWLSRDKGIFSLEMRKLGTLDPSLRPQYGKQLNQLKAQLESTLESLYKQLKEAAHLLDQERLRQDLTFPGYAPLRGHRHPLLKVRDDVVAAFSHMGFSLMETPEVETDFSNFEGLNIPKDHPARDTQDTFYLGENLLLRTHCTCVQIHAMLASPPPLRVIGIGKVYRRDNPDATHSPCFWQCDGFAVDERITLADLKGTLVSALRQLFTPDVRVRLRPSYFSFVEPGAEVDISCIFCAGKGCRICKQSGWIEILGAGMIHPKVFKHVGYNETKYTGFAWGMGLDRIAMLKYGIDDIRLLYENDLRFLQQF
jgi:phenylalanyl-tRNA synthetase alpha chain